ncbi:MAG: 2-oxoacid:acceptor oxidoreductase subunit alpha [Candidatus Latescibacteria bacterium]|nr:2-oxoacid:acceptor oxidoreductase subunit alpha [Candidatus Latescibacterota bacterium]
MTESAVSQVSQEGSIEERESLVIRFSGDSMDGMQVTGEQFTNTSAVLGNDVSTVPDFPAEIQAPAGTIPGLSGFQVNYSSNQIFTAGDAPHVLVAMNPAALVANVGDLEPGGVIVVNTDGFTRNNVRKAGLTADPLEDPKLKQDYEVYEVPLASMTREVLDDLAELTTNEKDRCKNAFALGLTFWMFERQTENTLKFYRDYYGKRGGKFVHVAEALCRALIAGYNYGETTEAFQGHRIRVPRRESVAPGVYRRITGNQALVMGLVTGARKANKTLFYGSYPITPASTILEGLSALKNYDVKTFQAEDEIAAIGSIIGAAFGGAMAATASSGPGIALKSEGINLAVVLELPMVIIDVQRGGPSTGLPTKPEQADLLEVLYGRNGESPVPVLAPATSGECFDLAVEAYRIAARHMTPVYLLSDAYLANKSEPWKIPNPDDIESIQIKHHTDPQSFMPYKRDAETLARAWALPGTPGLEHRIGGLGKEDGSGNVSYSPQDHQHIVDLRAEKVARIADYIPELEVVGPERGKLLVLGWGGTYGALHAATLQARREGLSVASAHLRYLNPFPRNLEDVLNRYDQVLIPEMNMGQLALLIQGHFRVKVERFNKVQGQPFKIQEVLDKIKATVG